MTPLIIGAAVLLLLACTWAGGLDDFDSTDDNGWLKD